MFVSFVSSMQVEVRIVENGDEFKLNLSLAHAINVHRSMTKVYGTKVCQWL